MSNIDDMPPKCYDCPYWELAENPYVCEDCMIRLEGGRKCVLNWIKTCNKLPKSGLWFVCKVKSSDNLIMVCGFEEVTEDLFDAWAEVKCPY